MGNMQIYSGSVKHAVNFTDREKKGGNRHD